MFREADRRADNLAKRACSLTSDFVVLDVRPNSLRLIATTLPFMAS